MLRHSMRWNSVYGSSYRYYIILYSIDCIIVYCIVLSIDKKKNN